MRKEGEYLRGNLSTKIVRWRHRAGLVLIGVPVLCLILLIILVYCTAVFKFTTGQEIFLKGDKRDRAETRIVEDQHYAKYKYSAPFQKVTEEAFFQAQAQENLETIVGYAVTTGLLSIVLGVLLINCPEPPPPADPESIRALNALGKEYGIKV